RPQLSETLRKSPFVFLANINPELQESVLEQFADPTVVACDTMNHWIASAREPLAALLPRVDLLVVNDEEAAPRRRAGHRARRAPHPRARTAQRARQARRVRRHPLLARVGVRGPRLSAGGGLRPDRRGRRLRGRAHGLPGRHRRALGGRAPARHRVRQRARLLHRRGLRRAAPAHADARRHRPALPPVRGADRVLSTPAPALSIVIPVYDEAESLGPLFAELGPALAALDRPAEVVAVDDGSTDGSFERLVALASGDPSIRIVRLARNYGQTAALAAGIEHARAPVIVSLDADLQNDPADIPRLLAVLDGGVDVVNGWRSPRRDPWLTRRLPSQIA